MNLQLSLTLKRQWFEMTKAGIKTEDYREITPYWANRLLLDLNGNVKSRKYWDHEFELNIGTDDEIKENIDLFAKKKPFNSNKITDGYPSDSEVDRIIKYKHAGIEIRTGRPEWGAEEGKLYFVIKHGKQIK